MPDKDKAGSRGGRYLWRLVPLILILGAALYLIQTRYLQPGIVSVKVARVEFGVVEDTIANTRAGSVKVRHRAKISPQIGGRVIELLAEKGQRIRKGDLLLRLDDTVLRARLLLAQRSLQTVGAKAEEACFAADQAAKELRRNLDLKDRGITSAQLLDRLQTEEKRTAAACRAALASVAEAKASATLAEAQLELTRVVAPFDGIIADVSTELGEWVTPSPPGLPMPPVIDLLDPESIYISAPIDEMDAERIHKGLAARLSVDSRQDEVFDGHITRIAPFVEDSLEQNRTIEVEAEFDNAEIAATLVPGLSADVEIILEKRDHTLRIPSLAIADSDKVLVFIDGQLEQRRIRTGLTNWQMSEVLEGLREGELVVITRDSTHIIAGARAQIDHGTD